MAQIDRTLNPPQSNRRSATACNVIAYLMAVLGLLIALKATTMPHSPKYRVDPLVFLLGMGMVFAGIFLGFMAIKLKKPLALYSFTIKLADGREAVIQISPTKDHSAIERLTKAAQTTKVPKREPEQALLAALETDLAELDIAVCRVKLMAQAKAAAEESGGIWASQ